MKMLFMLKAFAESLSGGGTKGLSKKETRAYNDAKAQLKANGLRVVGLRKQVVRGNVLPKGSSVRKIRAYAARAMREA